ncbi:LOW QUALITY PROTEIN: eukaryotic translation initiation factor 2 subunit 2-like [Cebus imitator]|uniref:LOW QUALITY PROTEIN: eukaryotic translation initiation factor 2 subunit 2-like n=1 Tax=Cebus imitator TaxID=2715852 RepID=UPI00189898C5|nr:LOW QUALITY PROTEIN: eukaryotic translation initiation factor 2 subunit 2-like [Cebus imitator]
MSGDKMIFDPAMSKKKKKKKKPFMLDEEGDTQTEKTQPSETKEVEPEPTGVKDLEADEEDNRKKDAPDDLDDLNFFNQKKKKKKKTKKIFDIDEAEEGVKDLKIESDVQEPAEQEDDLDVMLGNKKKKKKNVKFPDEDEILEKDEALEHNEDSKKDDGIPFSNQTGPAWAGSERGYTYEELLNRVRENNPDMVAGEKRKFVKKPSQVVRAGTKKTSFVNFTDTCKLLHRQPKHLPAFLLAELGTSGSIDGNNQLVIKGRFQQKQIENVLRRYIKEYVTCHTCRSPDTILQKDTRLYFLQCETCHSRCSVASIKTGFLAVTGKRAQLRAKAN